MIKRLKATYILLVLVIGASLVASGQQPGTKDTVTNKKFINIIQSKRLDYERKDTVEFQSLVGDVIVRQDKTLFYCDSAIINRNLNVLEAFGHVHINDADSVHTYSDYLKYLGNEKKAYLKNNVKLTDGKGVLTTKNLEYNTQSKIGIYSNGGKLVNGNSVLTSEEGYYYGETRDAFFKKKVKLVTPDYTIETDTLPYNTYTGVANFVVPTIITSTTENNRRVKTSSGFYDSQKKYVVFGSRPSIQDGSTFLDADDVASNDSTGYSEARGNVIYRDTAQGLSIFSGNLKTSRVENSFLATIQPVMVIKQDTDSLFIAADTLYSARLSDLIKSRNVPDITGKESDVAKDTSLKSKVASIISKPVDSTDRFFEAYFNVRIYSDSMQAVGDSLFYSAKDSVFRLFRNPIVWNNENQISGDTIYLYTQHKKPKRLYVFENAITISKLGEDYYNQVKGRTINGYFKEGNIDFLRAKGNSEAIYYGQDENNRFVGVNRATAEMIDLYFDQRKPERVVMRTNLKGTTYPMRQVNHSDMRLRGFKWIEDKRPKSKYELFGK